MVDALPDALARFDAVAAAFAGRAPALFVDYDGTLTPIVAHPDLAVPSPEVTGVLAALARRMPVAVISGRDRADLERRVGIAGLIYVGSHGLDIGLAGAPAPAEDFRPAIDAAEAGLRATLADLPGALVERKALSVAAHWRQVDPARAATVREAVARVLAGHAPRLTATPGKMVLEIRPALDWGKGHAVLWLLGRLGPGRVPLFLGDDITDEDAFAALSGRGIGIVVANPAERRPTGAIFRLSDPAAVLAFLKRLLQGSGA